MNKKFNKAEDSYIRTWAKKIKAIEMMGGKCNHCGKNDIWVIDFHHPEEDKEYCINRIKDYRWSLIEKEAKKCILLCANCHTEFHCNADGRQNNIKKDILNKLGFSGCNNCGYIGNNLASLDFHHIKEEDKIFNIYEALNRQRKVSVEELFEEIKKCKILCRNCHRQHHFDIDTFNLLKYKIYERMNTYSEIQKPLDRETVFDMYYNQHMKQCEIVKKMGCAKSTISIILNKENNMNKRRY